MDKTAQISFIAQASTPVTAQSSVPPAATGLDWTTIIVAIVTGVTTGVIVPIVSPYVKWHFAKKERLERKNEHIVQELRKAVKDHSMTVEALLSHEFFPHIRHVMGPQWGKRLDNLKSEYDSTMYLYIRHEMIKEYGIDIDSEMSDEETIKTKKQWHSLQESIKPEMLKILNGDHRNEIDLLVIRAIAVLERNWKLVGQ